VISPQDDPRPGALQRAGQARIGVRWNRITPHDLLEVLSRAVARSLSTHAEDLPLSRLRTIRSTALKLFVQGVRGRARTMVALPKQRFLRELDKNKNRLLMQCDDARAELRRLAGSVGNLRNALPEPKAVDPTRDRELDQELEQGLRKLFKLHGFGGERGRCLKEGVVAYVLSSSRQQRWEHLKDRLGEHRSQIDLLERRINKLTMALDRTEKVLHEVIHARQLDEAGIASIYREVQGLAILDGQLLLKQEMLKAIFDANIQLHKVIAA
jgi:hypothetical protein